MHLMSDAEKQQTNRTTFDDSDVLPSGTFCTYLIHGFSTKLNNGSPRTHHSRIPFNSCFRHAKLSPTLTHRRGVKAAYWASFDDFPASSIDTSYFTHIYYAFLLPNPTTYQLDITPFDQQKLPEFRTALQGHRVKTLLSIGGGGNNPNVFSKMVSGKFTRSVFINSTIEVAVKYGFSGIDLDWEFPADEIDMSNLALLYKEWRLALKQEDTKPRLLPTSAVYFSAQVFLQGTPRSYPAKAIRKYVNWVSPMCFDYHHGWEKFTGEHSALYDPKSNISTSFGIRAWIEAGVPPQKIVMGLPLYGHTWTLQDPTVNGVGAPAVRVGPGNGALPYNQILVFNTNNRAKVVFDPITVSFYSYAGVTWIGYDDVLSISQKVEFAWQQGLGGYFFWALGQDKDWTLSRYAYRAWLH